MTRRSAFDRLKENAQSPSRVSFRLPRRERSAGKRRTWEKGNRGTSYFIPAPLNEQAKDIRASILALASASHDHHLQCRRGADELCAAACAIWES